MFDTALSRLRARPFVAASGAVALAVLLFATAALVSVVGPGAVPDPGGQRLGTAVLATIAGVALLWILVVVRVVHGVVVYADTGDRPLGVGFALAAGEGAIALVMLVVASAAGSLANNSSGGEELLAIAAYVVAVVGLGLALVTLARATVSVLGVDPAGS